jgi:GNAT superfamily N-acetyltransferase
MKKRARIIREGREADFEHIRKIVSSAIRACVVDSDEQHDVLFKDVCSSFEQWGQNRAQSLFLVCEKGEAIQGVILVKEYWNITVLFVDPEQQGLGVGRALLSEAMRICRSRSPKPVMKLNSSKHAVPFYRRMGFRQSADGLDRPGGCVPFEYDLRQSAQEHTP